MAIQVFCQCGASLSVPPALAGKKVKCKGCGTVLKIPAVPGEAPAQPAAPPAQPDAPPAAPAVDPMARPAVEEFQVPEYEEVKAGEEKPIACPACGALARPGDDACLACGTELEVGGSAGLVGKVPKPVLFGVVALVMFTVLGLVGRTLWRGSRPAARTSEGLALSAKGDHDGARRAFEEALEFDPEYQEATIALAQLGVDRGNDGLVERYAPKAIERIQDPTQRARLRLALARSKLAAEDHETARNQAVDAKDEDKALEHQARGILGLAALMAGKKDEALAQLKAAAPHVNDPSVHLELARLLQEKGQLVPARTAAEQSVKAKADDPAAWLLVAELRERTGDARGARDALLEVVKHQESNSAAHARLSRLYLADGKADLAEKAAARAVELQPDDRDANLALGRVQAATGRPEAAKTSLEKALREGGSGGAPWELAWEAEFLLGKALFDAGSGTEGVTRVQAALDKRKDDLPLHLEAARMAIAAGDGAAAATFLQAAMRSFESSYDVHLLMARALALQENGAVVNEAGIRAELERCIKLDRDRPEASLALGVLLHDKLELEPAIEVLSVALRANPTHKELLYWKARACSRAKRWDEAIQALEALQKLGGFEDSEDQLRRAQQERFYEQGGRGG